MSRWKEMIPLPESGELKCVLNLSLMQRVRNDFG